MISDACSSLVRCPECHGELARAGVADLSAAAAGRIARPIDAYPRPAAGGSVRRADEIPRRGAARRRAARAGLAAAARLEDPQRHAARVPRAARPATASSISAAAAAAPWCGIATRAPTAVGIDISPFFSEDARQDVPSAARRSAAAAVRRRHVQQSWSLDVLEHLSPEALRAMLTEANRVLATGGALFVYTHVRKNAPIAAGLRWINRLARGLERIGLIDMRQERLRKSDHLNPLADVPGSRARRARTAASASRASRSTRRSSAASSRTS